MSLFSFGSDKSKQRVWRPQGDALRGLYDQAGGAGLPGLGADASSGVQPFIDQASQTAMGQNPALQGLQSLATGQSGAMQNLQGLATGQNPVLDNLAGLATGGQDYSQGMIDNLSQNLGRFYQEQLLPGIRGNAVNAGGLGGARQQLAQGTAAGRVADAFGQGVNNINFQQQGVQNQAAQNYAGIQTGAAGTYGGLQNAAAGTYGDLQAQGINQGMQGVGAQFGFGVDPYLQLANIYGTSPGTLNTSKGYGFGIGGSGD